MLAGVAEFFCWTGLGLFLGFAGHWWKSHADPYPDILDKDQPMLNVALTEHTMVNYALDHRYDDAGYWEYLSLKNLKFYLFCGVAGVLLPVYASTEGHNAARSALCSITGTVGLTPLFCP